MNATNNTATTTRHTSLPSFVANHSHSTTKTRQLPTIRIAPKTSPLSEAIAFHDFTTPSIQQVNRSSFNTAMTQDPAPDITTMTTPVRFSANKAIWYLGGNHAAKLLTSVDGDFDPEMLAQLASVPAVIGELALSVESLVSDDLTVGGFENDLLAKIAANTLNGKRAASISASTIASSNNNSSNPSNSLSPSSSTAPSAILEVTHSTTSSPVLTTGSVPNPLLNNYDPVPNPLARITPPGSPTPVMDNGNVNGKRKDSPNNDDEEHRHTNKALRRTETFAGVVQAR